MSTSRSQAEKDAKIQKFEAFIEEKLKPDLVHVISQRDKITEDKKVLSWEIESRIKRSAASTLNDMSWGQHSIHEYISDLAKNIKLLEKQRLKKMRTLVNLGSEVYVQAEVPDTSRIFISIGLGFHVEFTWSEALQFISDKEEILVRQLEEHNRQISRIKAQIKLVGEGIRELMNLSQTESVK